MIESTMKCTKSRRRMHTHPARMYICIRNSFWHQLHKGHDGCRRWVGGLGWAGWWHIWRGNGIKVKSYICWQRMEGWTKVSWENILSCHQRHQQLETENWQLLQWPWPPWSHHYHCYCLCHQQLHHQQLHHHSPSTTIIFVFPNSLQCFSLSPPNVVTIIYALVMTDNKAFKKPGVVIREGPKKITWK